MAPVSIDRLAEALRLGPHELVSLVGGGGKTTALFALGDQLAGSAILTTTTKMGRDQTGGLPLLFSPDDEEMTAALDRSSTVLAWKGGSEHKADGVDAETCDHWFGLADHVLVEADGSRGRPFKAPRPYEPVIPSRTTTLVACVGAEALGRVIADQCQRPLRVAAVAGCSPYQRLTAPRLAAVLQSDRGSRKDCPPDARFAVLINQATERHGDYIEELVTCLDDRAPVVCVAPFASDRR